MKLNEKIYYCRKKAGLSQDALAEKIGVSRQAVSKWELGSAQPELDKLVSLARMFEVTADWLLSEEEPEDYVKPEEDPEPPPQNAAPKQTYPAWVDDLPGFIGRTLKKYGWIYGVYLSVVGAMFTGLGALGRYIVGQMTSAVNGPGSFAGFGTPEIVVENGAELTPEIEAAILSEIYGMGYSASPFSGMTSGIAENNPVTILCGFIMGVGIMMIVAGVLIAVVLKRYGDREE